MRADGHDRLHHSRRGHLQRPRRARPRCARPTKSRTPATVIPERSGQYHYHELFSLPERYPQRTGGTSDLLGYALDGFGIYGPYDEDGEVVTDADLDACHGRTSEVMWNGKLTDIYHYQFTEEYPYTIGCFTGTPQQVGGNSTVAGDPSHDMQGAGIQAPGMPGMQGLRRPPRGPRPGRRRG